MDLNLEVVLGVVVVGAEGADSNLPLMIDVGWGEDWDRSADPVVTESTDIVGVSECCLPRVGRRMGLSRSVMSRGVETHRLGLVCLCLADFD